MSTYAEIKATAWAARQAFPKLNGRKVCTAVAWAAITDEPLDVAVGALFKHTGRLPGDIGWGDYLNAFNDEGYAVRLLDTFKGSTVLTVARHLGAGRYLLEVSGGTHVAAVVGGEVIDWCAGSRRRVSRVWRVWRL